MSCDTHWRQYIVHGPGLSRDILLPSLAVAGHVIEFQYRGLALVSRDKHYTCDVLQSRFFQHYNIIHIFVIRDRENSLSHFLLSDLTNHESRKTPYVLLDNGSHKTRIEKITFRTFCYRTSQITFREKRLMYFWLSDPTIHVSWKSPFVLSVRYPISRKSPDAFLLLYTSQIN